jgi:hypothetical protein
MSKYANHRDLDAKLWPAIDNNPMSLFVKLGCLATVILAVSTWLVLLGMMVAEWIEWQAWPYVVVPIGLWLALLAVPLFFSARRGTLAIINAIAMTAEAWLARAGYSIDLNNDYFIGHIQPVQVEPPRELISEPTIWRKGAEVKLLTQETPTAIKVPEEEQAESAPRETIERRLWRCPNGYKVPVKTLEFFVDQVFDGHSGWSRGEWVPDVIEREDYDAIILQLEQAKLLEGRKPRHSGKKTVEKARQARMVLGLPMQSLG